MMMTIDRFLKALRKAALLSEQEYRSLCAGVLKRTLPSEPIDLVDHLVNENRLTVWQGRELMAGRTEFHLGQYRLLDQLGAGGMGVVYRARHERMGRLVAIKVMRPKCLPEGETRRRFLREIEAVSRLQHPNIVQALDANQIGDKHFLVMEFVGGRPLSWWLERYGRLPVPWACECIRQACLGLQHAFENGLVHRDIKPDNLLIRAVMPEGRPEVKILDLGLARFSAETRSDDDLTGDGQILGTVDYIAPEQGRCTRTADIRSDIYSLGATCFRMLTGRLPFVGANAVEKLMARYQEDPPMVTDINRRVPKELAEVVNTMLARDPRDRFQVPGAVAKAIEPYAMPQGGLADYLPKRPASPSGSSIWNAQLPVVSAAAS